MNLDSKIFLFLNSIAGKTKAGDIVIAILAEYLAYGILAIALIDLFTDKTLIGARLPILLVSVVAGLISRFVIAAGIRIFYKRHRPYLVHRVHNVLSEKSFSFPSGHSTFFYAFSAVFFFYSANLGIVLLSLTVIMTVFRVVAGVHYLSDIAAGAVIGLFSAWMAVAYLAPAIAAF